MYGYKPEHVQSSLTRLVACCMHWPSLWQSWFKVQQKTKHVSSVALPVEDTFVSEASSTVHFLQRYVIVVMGMRSLAGSSCS